MSLCSWIGRTVEINREKEVQSSLVSFAHRALNLLLKEFSVQAHILKILVKKKNQTRNKATKPLASPVGNRWQQGAQGTCLAAGATLPAAHWQKNGVAGRERRLIQEGDFIASAPARACAQAERRQPARAARGAPGGRPPGSVWLEPSPCTLLGLAVKVQPPKMGGDPLLGPSWQRRCPRDWF